MLSSCVCGKQQTKMNYQMERELGVSTEQKRITMQRSTAKKNTSDSKEVVERARKSQAGAQREQVQKISKWRDEQAVTDESRNRDRNNARGGKTVWRQLRHVVGVGPPADGWTLLSLLCNRG